MTCSRIRQALVVLGEGSLRIQEGCGDDIFGDTLTVGSRNDNPNTTQTLEYTKDKYNVKIIKQRVSSKVPPTTVRGMCGPVLDITCLQNPKVLRPTIYYIT
jgi:hypothetical protein